MMSSMKDKQNVEISLFPIPGSVSLPWSIVPLHIFEPRYRKMIKDSIEQNRRVGVAHTKRLLSPGKSKISATHDEYLNSNQETYEAYPIFSAGFAEILESLPDGRLIVQIKMDSRYEIIEERQQVPYKIVICAPYTDEENFETEATDHLRKNLNLTFVDLAGDNKDLMETFIAGPGWKDLSMNEYSFAIYSLVLLGPEIMQKVLELKSDYQRILFLYENLTPKYLQ
jgi:Lon protease-like protein